MKKKLTAEASGFLGLKGIEYFNFEEDFVEKNVRCIPMIVRFKMDKAGIKLKLTEWSKFTIEERIELAKKDCSNKAEAKEYNDYLSQLIEKHTGKTATVLNIDTNLACSDLSTVPALLNDKLREFGWSVSVKQWSGLTNLQRFSLLKLCREGHENKNLPKAMKEFGLFE